MSDDTRREAVEAADNAIAQCFRDADANRQPDGTVVISSYTAAQAAYDAIEPHVRQAVAEEIADSLREHYDPDEDRVRFGDWESCSDQCPGVLMDYVLKLVDAAAIARQVGGQR